MDSARLDDKLLAAFRNAVWDYYHEHGRHTLPWRQALTDGTFDPYRILVSELMLQQTQVPRVVPKYVAFMSRFPDVRSLANATLGDVIREWSGLGYNRRAKYLHDASKMLIAQRDFPRDTERLTNLPGVGPNTAGAVQAYAFNMPSVFIETNIRTVFILHFFSGESLVTDAKIRELVRLTMDQRDPRQWYWGLMDYGTKLKSDNTGINRASAGYAKQSPFQGSNRQIRGQVLNLLKERPQTIQVLRQHIPDKRLEAVLTALEQEGLIVKRARSYRLA